MNKTSKDQYLNILEDTLVDLQEKKSNMTLYIDKLLVEIDSVLDEYSDEWRYIDEAIADLDPVTQPWISNVNKGEVDKLIDRYDTAVDICNDLTDTGEILEKAVDKLRDAKRYLKSI